MHLAFEVDDLTAFSRCGGGEGLSAERRTYVEWQRQLIAFIDAPEGYEVELIQRSKRSA